MKKVKKLFVLSLLAILTGCNNVTNSENNSIVSSTPTSSPTFSNVDYTSKKYENSIKGVSEFLNDMKDAKNYTVSYDYEGDNFRTFVDSNYIYYESEEDGYVIIKDFFNNSDKARNAVFSFKNDEENKSITPSSIYYLTTNTGREVYPENLTYNNPVDYYLYGGYVKNPSLGEENFSLENNYIVSTNHDLNYYIASLAAYGSYIEDGSAVALSYSIENNNKLVVNLMVFADDGVSLLPADGAQFEIYDISSSHFENAENFINNSASDFAEQPIIDSNAFSAFSASQWSLDITRDYSDDKGNITKKNYIIKYDYDTTKGHDNGVSWKEYNTNNALLYSLYYKADEQGKVYTTEINYKNEEIDSLMDGEISAFNSFNSYNKAFLWKKNNSGTYSYYGQNISSILASLTMLNYDNTNVNYLKAYTKQVDGKEVVDYFEALLFTPSFTLEGVITDASYEVVKVKVNYNTEIRNIDTTLGSKLPDNVQGVTDRIKTAIDRSNDKTKSYSVTSEQFNTKTNKMYKVTTQTFTNDIYLVKTVTEGVVDYRGIKKVNDKIVYFKVENGKVVALSDENTNDTVLNQYPIWDCSPAIYEKTGENSFSINGKIKEAEKHMPIKASDAPSYMTINLDPKTNYLDTITYTVDTFGGYLVYNYTYKYNWGTNEKPVDIEDSEIKDLKTQIENLSALKENELPKTWKDDRSNIVSKLQSMGFTDKQIESIPYLYAPSLSGNWATFDVAAQAINIYSRGNNNKTQQEQYEYVKKYRELVDSNEWKEKGWYFASKDPEAEIYTYKNNKTNLTMLIYSNADYGITILDGSIV